MQHSEFSIGTEFFTDTGQWRCTDIGTRTVVAIKISEIRVTTQKGDKTTQQDISDDPTWFNGPPYAVAEHIFDEDGISGCWENQPLSSSD